MENEKLTEAVESIIDGLQEALYEYQILENEIALKIRIARAKGKMEELLNEN